jgi:hypothetical protein
MKSFFFNLAVGKQKIALLEERKCTVDVIAYIQAAFYANISLGMKRYEKQEYI